MVKRNASLDQQVNPHFVQCLILPSRADIVSGAVGDYRAAALPLLPFLSHSIGLDDQKLFGWQLYCNAHSFIGFPRRPGILRAVDRLT